LREQLKSRGIDLDVGGLDGSPDFAPGPELEVGDG
jgi:hypothetical protein